MVIGNTHQVFWDVLDDYHYTILGGGTSFLHLKHINTQRLRIMKFVHLT